MRASILKAISTDPTGENTYTHQVVGVLAVSRGLRADACTDAELVRTHKVDPLVELLSGSKYTAVNETTDGVALTICTAVVELASYVLIGDVDLGEVTPAGDLDVLGGLHEVDAFEGASGHHAGAVAGLGAVRDHLAFGVADDLRVGGPHRQKSSTLLIPAS